MNSNINKSEFPYQELVTHTCVVCAVLDKSSEVCEANDLFYQLIGVDRDSDDTLFLHNLIANSSSWNQYVEKLNQVQDATTHTIQLFKPNGKPIYLKSNMGMRDNRIYLAGIDVTEEEETFATLKRASHIARVGGWSFIPSEERAEWTDCIYEILEIEDHDSLQPESIYNYIHDDSRKLLETSIEKLYRELVSYDIEIKLVTARSNTIWARVCAVPQVKNGKMVYVQGILQEINRYKQQEQILLETTQNMELALRAINSGYFTHDLINDEIYYSESFCSQMNIDRMVPEEEFRKLIYHEDRAAAYARHMQELSTESLYYVNAYRINISRGAPKHFEVHGFKVFEDGRPIKLVGNLIDVEDKYRLNQLQDKHRYHLKTLLDNTFVRSILLDSDWKIIGLDGLTKELFSDRLGYNPILKKVNFKDILSPHDRLKFNIIERALDKKEEYRNQIYLDLFKSARTYYDALFRPVLDYSKKVDGYVFYFFDLTHQVRAQEELNSYREKVRTVHHFKNSIINKIGHEIKTPLKGLLQTTQQLIKKENFLKEDEEMVRKQQQRVDNLMRSFDELIASSLKDENTLHIQKPVDLKPILNSMKFSLINRAHLKDLDFELRNYKVATIVPADPIFLKQALDNLFLAAIDQTTAGKLTLNCGLKDQHALLQLTIDGTLSVDHLFSQGLAKNNLEDDSQTKEEDDQIIGKTFSLKYLEGIGGHMHVDRKDQHLVIINLALPLA
jgi:PAS domain-containing protein/signal transduction histidine kinase